MMPDRITHPETRHAAAHDTSDTMLRRASAGAIRMADRAGLLRPTIAGAGLSLVDHHGAGADRRGNVTASITRQDSPVDRPPHTHERSIPITGSRAGSLLPGPLASRLRRSGEWGDQRPVRRRVSCATAEPPRRPAGSWLGSTSGSAPQARPGRAFIFWNAPGVRVQA